MLPYSFMAESPILSCCVPPEVKAEVERLAAERGWSKSKATSWLLGRALKQYEDERRAGFHEVKI